MTRGEGGVLGLTTLRGSARALRRLATEVMQAMHTERLIASLCRYWMSERALAHQAGRRWSLEGSALC